MNALRPLMSRLGNSAVVWSWAYNLLRLASGILLLPLLLRLPGPDFGMYYVLLSLTALVPLLDIGLTVSFSRAVSYAMGGATELQSQGTAQPPGSLSGPNFPLLWKLMHTTRALYRLLAIGVFVVLGVWGTYVVRLRLEETSVPAQTWLAWALTLAGAVFEMYAGWWNVYLGGLNRVVASMRIGLLAQSIRLGVAGGLLLMDGGLLSVPMAALVSSFVQRWLSRRHCLAFLSTQPVSRPERTETTALVKVLWPNSWRVGLYLLSGYLTINANTFLCLKFLGLAANAQYGLSIQIMNILQGMASVWIAVKWPLIGQFVARHDYEGVCAVFRPRLALHLLTFVMMSAVVLPLAPPLLRWLGTDKTILPWHWMLLLAGNALLELNYRTWTTLISLTNRLPFLWFSVAGNVLSLALALGLIRFTPLGMGALVLSPLISGGAFNYWLWPAKGARLFQSSLLRFLLLRSDPPRLIAPAPAGVTDIKNGTSSS